VHDELGPVEVTWQTRPERWAALVGVGVVTILMWTLLLALGRIHLLVYLAAVVTTKLLIAMRLLPALARRVSLHADGLLVVELGGARAVRFDALQAYYVATYPRVLPWPGESPVARILRLDPGGSMVRIEDDLDGFDLLLARIVTEVESRRSRAIRHEFANDKWVGFGPLRLHRTDGLAFADGQVRWVEAPVIRHQGDSLRIAGLGVCPLGLIPLPHLLASMLADQGAVLEGVLEALSGRRPG